ncbi:MAG TPA: hypothetical protein VEV62_17385 [Parafilimonas sp.]|nr:hypothetical protein [Parafilimonas sp.]
MRTVSFCVCCIMIIACSQQSIIHLQRKDIVETVYASGKIISNNEYNMYALSSGTVIKKLMMNEVDQTFRVDAILSHNKEKSIITVTHDIDFAKRADRIIEIADGRIISQ